MGRCIKLPLPPLSISVQLPGGAKAGSMASGTQEMPNDMDPFQSLLEAIQPALAPLKPTFDIIGFIMSMMELMIQIFTILGVLSAAAAPGNPLTILFPVQPIKDGNGDPITPEVPDLPGLIPKFIDSILKLVCYGLKSAGLVPQLSAIATIKDSLITALGFMDAAMGQVNSLSDSFADLASPETGNSFFDELRVCAAENSEKQLEAKLGPIGNLVPLMSIVSLLAEAAAQPLPGAVYDMSKLLANPAPTGFGVIPFFDAPLGGPTADEQRENFLTLIQDLTITGLPIEIPDFSNLSTIPETMEEIKEKLEPLVPVIELVQEILDKITKC